MLIVVVPITVICVLLIVAKVPQWLNIMVLVILMFILFAAYIKICEKFDERKKERMSKKKDPFAD